MEQRYNLRPSHDMPEEKTNAGEKSNQSQLIWVVISDLTNTTCKFQSVSLLFDDWRCCYCCMQKVRNIMKKVLHSLAEVPSVEWHQYIEPGSLELLLVSPQSATEPPSCDSKHDVCTRTKSTDFRISQVSLTYLIKVLMKNHSCKKSHNPRQSMCTNVKQIRIRNQILLSSALFYILFWW